MEKYLKKNSFLPKQIETIPESNLGLIVVIPAHDEFSLIPTFKSLAECSKTTSAAEVIVVFNASEIAEKEVIERNKNACAELKNWYSSQLQLPFQLYIIECNSLPKKHAGVGLARKIGMDEAVRRFAEVDNKNGVIICFDADSKCKPNYLVEIEKHFKKQLKTAAASIHFEHPRSGNEFDIRIYEGICFYELHLRYYKNALAYAGFPFAFHTIGSSMAVRAVAYSKEGGMNRRKAGEDFYFLQKFISNNELSEINSTTVIPSPRPSHRVPFGTGKAIQEMLDEERKISETYAFESFVVMKKCFLNHEEWFNNTPKFQQELIDFYGEDFLLGKVEEIRSQSANIEGFKKRLFQWFSAFQALKFVHFLRDNGNSNQFITIEIQKLLVAMHLKVEADLLKQLRVMDCKNTIA